MLVLAVDTATPAVTAALAEVSPEGTADGLKGLGERRTVDPRAHGELLAPQIRAVLGDAGVSPAELGAIVAGTGPGPYTGLRVGLVTAAAMGHALNIPVYGVCSLDGLGRAAGPGRVLVATDARRREVYYGFYLDGVRVTGPEVAKPADVAMSLAGQAVGEGADVGVLAERAVGEGAVKYSEVFGVPVDPAVLYPPGEALIALALPRILAGAESEVLTPLYLRRPDAVAATERKNVLQ